MRHLVRDICRVLTLFLASRQAWPKILGGSFDVWGEIPLKGPWIKHWLMHVLTAKMGQFLNFPFRRDMVVQHYEKQISSYELQPNIQHHKLLTTEDLQICKKVLYHLCYH